MSACDMKEKETVVMVCGTSWWHSGGVWAQAPVESSVQGDWLY
jgi:hypothetical protein